MGAERSNTIRIPVALVDRLMTLAGEVVLVRNQALRSSMVNDSTWRPMVQRLDAVTAELQDAVLRTRMQPVGNLFGKFPRMVRDLAKQLGKQIKLEVSGTEVELDKTILEALSDPLTHLIRNCCDHGVEAVDQRLAAGKPVEGRIQLSARHLGGQIYIEVRDDGRGLDAEKIKRKALEQGLRSSAELARLGEKDLLGLILLPGFSTAAEVTDLSGRGVGMDVVKTNLERLGGVLEIDSRSGLGTAFSLRLPLTLAIIPCLVVTVGPERYAIPQKDLEELVCLHANHSRRRIEYAHDQEVFRLRDRLLPLVRLGEVLRRPAPFTAATRADILRHHAPREVASEGRRSPGQSEMTPNAQEQTVPVYFAVVKVGSQRFGLIVDTILTTEEIVVKPMHATMKGLASFSGATIMGDGRVALILSIEGIARHAGVSFEVGQEQAVTAPDQLSRNETQTVLLFKYGPQEQFAVPLAMIRGIEMVRTSKIEHVGTREFLTVKGISTPVVRLDQFLSVSSCVNQEHMFLLLPKNVRRPFGLLLSAVIDTEALAIDLNPDALEADGLIGSAIIRGQMTLFLDIHRLADLMEARNRSPSAASPAGHRHGQKKRILLVEDTQFFRQLVKGYLEAIGHEVTTANNGVEGLERLDQQSFDLVVSDIEMPGMDGWTFARRIRQRPDGASLPLLALTTLNNEADRQRAAACGFDRYEVKIDRDRFLSAVDGLLKG
jgi:two-component system chemotaxis sensor kinase CheA